MNARNNGAHQDTAAAKAGISERSGRRIESGQHSTNRTPRQYRTRKDPLDGKFEAVLQPLLEKNPALLPVTLFEHLQDRFPDEILSCHLRTIQRRVKSWRALYGPDKEVMFQQQHQVGLQGICDYTHPKNFAITIKGEPLKHRLFHFRLTFSGWTYVQVVLGGESFESLSSGLQNAFWRAGGVPQEVRTDSLSAAFNNHCEKETLTQNYLKLSKFYGFHATRNNPGVAHENGAIEGSHGHLKRRIEQQLALRGHSDFESLDAYQGFIDQIVNRINQRNKARFDQERAVLNPLPKRRTNSFSDLYVKVTSSSTISVKRVTYTVPSRLIGETLLVHLFDDHLDLYAGHQLTHTLPRTYAQGATRSRCVNYRDVIHSLAKKPGAFKHSKLRDDLIPEGDFTLIWRQLTQEYISDQACHLMVNLLLIAANYDCEAALGRFVLRQLEQGMQPNLSDCRAHFVPDIDVPPLVAQQHQLSDYNQLMEH